MIHYHGCPISGGDYSQLAYKSRHAMLSFSSRDCAGMIIELCQSFCLDNGAYSAWTAGREFDMTGFAGWVKDLWRHPGFDFYVMPDVIGGDEGDNAKMRSAWYQHCETGMWDYGYPVWHLHESLDVLSTLVNGFRGVAFGSSGEYMQIGTVKWWQRMSEAMSVATDSDGRPICKLHGLRMLDPTIFSHFPFASADSTNVARNAGLDNNWNGPYAPRTAKQRALVMMERIEDHASATRWTNSRGVTKNMELFG